MKVNTAPLPSVLKSQDLNALIIDAIQEIKGQNIVMLDLKKIEERPVDYFIICDGSSSTKVGAIARNISKRSRSELNISAYNIEGLSENKWVLLDYNNTLVHVFYPETREFYKLEDLWSDAVFTEFHSY